MTVTGLDIIFCFVCLALGGAMGWFGALFSVSSDKRLVRVPEDCLIIKQEVLLKLQEIAEIKRKNSSLKFDSRGRMEGVKEDDEEGS